MNQATLFTQNMQACVQANMQRIGSFYSKEDFEYILNVMQNAMGTSDYQSRKRELALMCETCFGAAQQGQGAAPQIDEIVETLLQKNTAQEVLAQVLSRAELLQELMAMLYELFAQSPKTEQLMQRAVNRLQNSVYANGSVRLAIVKQFLLHTNYHTAPLLAWVEAHLTARQQQEYATLLPQDAPGYLVAHTTEAIFDARYKAPQMTIAQWVPFWNKRVTKYQKDEGNPFVLSPAAMQAVETALQVAPGSLLQEALTKLFATQLAGGVLPPDDAAANKAFEAMETELRAALKTIPYQNKKGITCTKDEVYTQAKKDQRKAFYKGQNQQPPEIADETLLYLADDLASGRFYKDGSTKEALYLFAIAFDMQYYPPNVAKPLTYQPDLDIEKVLFHDYYNDNVLRQVYQNGAVDKTIYEEVPAGAGINCKNYIEVIYLYYLSQQGLSAAEKIEQTTHTIAACQAAAKGKKPNQNTALQGQAIEFALYDDGALSSAASQGQTVLFEARFVSDCLTLPTEQALVDYLVQHYEITTQDALHCAPKTTVQAACQAIATALLQEYPDSIKRTAKQVSMQMPFAISDWQSISTANSAPVSAAQQEAFLVFLSALQQRIQAMKAFFAPLGTSDAEGEIAIGADLPDDTVCNATTEDMLDDTAEDMANSAVLNDAADDTANDAEEATEEEQDKEMPYHRTGLVALYYYYFLFLLQDLIEDYGVVDFPSLYQEFCEGDGYRKGINAILEECGYQPISEKNIFDMFLLCQLFQAQLL